ncbi:class I SAM-dependent methyltransferase [Actinoplanes sp. NPDC049596]|uniref:class I SAM-dependent methyltransferase n=1 Tax=unclassified Actinoplanes TaxID=2626549 RepID=UPI00343D0071
MARTTRQHKRETTVDQAARWNGPGGQGWIDSQEVLEELFRPLEEVLVVDLPPGDVLDVGCGTGSTTAAIARRPGTRAVGIDVSALMVAAARERGVEAIEADAQTYGFEPAGFDTIVSRFGVMFFADPVRAFGNLRRAVRAGGGARLIVWREPADNPFMTTAERAARPLLPELPERVPDAPGQFGLADPERTGKILAKSGWSDVELAPLDVGLSMPVSELTGYFTRLGPVSRLLPSVPGPRRATIVQTVRAAFDPYVLGSEVRFTAACWLITARAG